MKNNLKTQSCVGASSLIGGYRGSHARAVSPLARAFSKWRACSQAIYYPCIVLGGIDSVVFSLAQTEKNINKSI